MSQSAPKQKSAQVHPKSAQVVHRSAPEDKAKGDATKSNLRNFPKTDVRYWKDALTRTKWESEDGDGEAKTFSVQIQYQHRRVRFPLRQSSEHAAASLARDIYLFLLANGWEATLTRFKPDAVPTKKVPTVGEYLTAARAVSGIRASTFETYCVKLRTVTAGVCNVETGVKRYGKKGAAEWREKVEAVKLSRLTPENVQKWAVGYLGEAGDDPAKQQSRKTSLNSVLRAARCLFVPRILRHLSHLSLPSPLPFEGVETPKVGRKRYVSRFSPAILYAKAEQELRDAVGGDDAEDKHEAFMILTLALFAGLRRDEIDTLTWGQIDWAGNRLVIETNEHTATKSANSEAAVSLPADVLATLKERHKAAKSEFVIASDIAPRPGAYRYHHYRCNRLFDVLTVWLRNNGVKERTPLHTLRKEFGSFVARKYGIFAASEALRHGDIRLTRDYYLAADTRATFSPADLLKEAGA